MKKRLLALLLALAMGLSLAACTAPAAEESGSPEPSPSPSASATPIDVDLSQDVLTFSAGDFAKETDVIVVNGVSVPTSLFLYWVAFSCSYFEGYYYYYGMTVADYADYILNDSCTMAAYYSLLEQKVAEYGCPLTDEQLAAINSEMKVDGEEHEQRKELYGLTHEDLMFIYSVQDYYDNLVKAVIPAPTEEDLNNYVYQAKHILLCTAKEGSDGSVVLSTGDAATNEDGSPFTGTVEEYNAQVLTKAEGLLAQLQAASSEELEPLFDQLMNEHSQDGRDAEGNLAAPDGYTTTKGKMVAEFEEAALALEPGQISGLVKSTYGYHIILRGEVEDPASYADEYATAEMDALVNQWLSEADIQKSDALKDLDVAQFYSRYLAWQEAYIAQQDTAEE